VQSLPAAQHLDTATFALEKMNPRVVSFEEQVSVLREGLAALHQAGKEWGKAAHVLAGIDLDSGIRVLTDEFKLQKCVQIAMLYLEDDDALNAETFIKKASFLLAACKVRGLTVTLKRSVPAEGDLAGLSDLLLLGISKKASRITAD
jgi:COP9 signalosome complex subunit 4